MDENSANTSKRKKRNGWTDGDAQVLLDVWAEHANDLRRAKRNGHIYQEMALKMKNKFSADEVHTKIRNFTPKYRDEKRQMGSSGGSPSNWKYYSSVHQIIGMNASNYAKENSTEVRSQPSPSPLSSPSPPLSPIDTSLALTSAASSSTSATPSSPGRKINYIFRGNGKYDEAAEPHGEVAT